MKPVVKSDPISAHAKIPKYPYTTRLIRGITRAKIRNPKRGQVDGRAFTVTTCREFAFGASTTLGSRVKIRKMYSAKVLKVMIASPGDVANERRIAREVVHEWNVVHSEERATVLMPVSWETHASPLMGDRPQQVINDQLLKSSDLLVPNTALRPPPALRS